MQALARKIASMILTEDGQRPKGQNIRRVLKTRQQAGRAGRSWTELHNAVLGKPEDSLRSSKNRGTNISRIARASGKPRGKDDEGHDQKNRYKKQPLIKKNKDGNYVITQYGVNKLLKLNKRLGKSREKDKHKEE